MDRADDLTADLGGARPPGVPRAMERGSVFGRYVVLDRLGTGGQGVVFAAWDGQLGRRVAIKLLLDGTLPGSVEESRLIQEARALAQLSHPNVVSVYELGKAETSHYVAMELVEGLTLKEVLQTEKREAEIVRLLAAAGEGLAAIHRAGLVHRDFKPANILVGRDGRVCLTDFGLALQVGPREDAETSSGGGPFAEDPRPGVAMGTLRYMGPELFAGSQATPRSDQFAFGVTGWLALTGEPPFADGVRHPLERTSLIEAGPVGQVRSRRLRQVLTRAMSADPVNRFASMELLLQELSGQRRQQRLRRVAAAVAVAAAPVALGIGLLVGRTGPDGCTRQAQRDLHWPPVARALLEARLKPSLGVEAAEEAVRGLDVWFDRWAVAAATACAEKRDDVCLSQSVEDASALVRLLSAADSPPEVVREAPLALLALPPAAACAGQTGKASSAERLPTVRLLSSVRAALSAGDPPRALAAATEATRRASLSADEALLAEANFELGRSLEAAGKAADAVEPLQRAQAEAVRLGLGDLEARAGIQQVHLLSGVLRKNEVAAALEPLVSAAVQREGRPGLHASYLAARGELRAAQGRVEEAQADLNASIEGERRREPPDARRIARLMSLNAMALVAAGKLEQAAQLSGQNVETMRRLVPANHPELGRALNNYSVAQLRIDDLSGARASILESAQALATALGEKHPHAAAPYNNLGDLELREGHLDEAQQAYKKAYDNLTASLGPSASRTLEARLGLAKVSQARGNFAAARQEIDAVLALRIQLYGPGHYQVVDAQLARAELALEAGDLASARPLLVAISAAGAQAPRETPLLEGIAALLAGQKALAEQWLEVAEYALQTAGPVRRAELALARDATAARTNTPLGRALVRLRKRK
jgi:eukaryotic-like serine/threonine-protein kinase